MRSREVWLWCLTALLLGCTEAPAPTSKVKVVWKGSYYELTNNEIVTRVALVKSTPPMTYAFTEGISASERYAARTEHDCKTKTSTLKHLSVYNERNELLESNDVNIVLDIEPGSVGEAEQEIACVTQKTQKGDDNV